MATPLCTTIRPQPEIGVPSSRKVTLPVGAGLPVNVARSVVDAPTGKVVGLTVTEGVVDAVPASSTVSLLEMWAKLASPGYSIHIVILAPTPQVPSGAKVQLKLAV